MGNMSWIEDTVSSNLERYSKFIADALRHQYKNIQREEKENATMQVTYNDFTGDLVKLEREDLSVFGVKDRIYNLSIYDSEKQVTHSFTGVKLEDVRFSGGTVTFGG